MKEMELRFKAQELQLKEQEAQMEFDMAGATAAREERTAIMESQLNLQASAAQHSQKLQQSKEQAALKAKQQPKGNKNDKT